MDIDLSAPPDDVETLQQMMRSLAVERYSLSEAQAGGADRWATVCSLITTVKLNGVEPFAYL